jgi:hypothetical protein
MSDPEDEDSEYWEEIDKDDNPVDPERKPLTDEEKLEQKRQKLQEEIELLGKEEAELLEQRRRKVKALKADPLIWSTLQDVDERNDARQQVGIDSPAGRVFGIERNSLLSEFRRSWYQHVTWLTTPQGGGLTIEDAVEQASRGHTKEAQEDKDAAIALYRTLLNRDTESMSWHSMSELHGRAPDLAEDLWLRMKREAREEFESGHYIAKLFEHNPHLNDPARRAEMLAIRESMHEQWKPQGGIEVSMVDTMAVSYFMMMFWIKKAAKMSTTDPRMESWDYRQWKQSHKYHYDYSDQKKFRRVRAPQWTKGHWDIPYIEESEAIEQTHQLADRWRRSFHASSRALRDWRRYSSPVIVQNAEQVNIAADGGQQVNLQEQKQNKKRKATTKTKQSKRTSKSEPKQLVAESPGESIRIETVPESIPVE